MLKEIKYLTFLVIFLTTSTCMAGDQPFFSGGADSVKNIFGKDLKIEKSYYREELPSTSDQVENSIKTPSTPQEKILSEYGDPAQPHEVKAIEDAPKPFKAMIEALKIGDKKLAFDYAVQYQNYLEDLERINRDMVSIQGVAMYKTGAMAEDTWVKTELEKNPDLKQFIDNQPQPANVQGKLEADARELLAAAKVKREDHDLFAGSNLEKRELSQADRAQARADLTGKVPFIPAGQVDVYFFLNPTEQKSIEQGKSLQAIYSKSDDQNILNVIGFSMDPHSESKIDNFKFKTGAQFVISPSADIAQQLGISSTPSTMIIDGATGNFYQLNGSFSEDYLDEAFKIVRGK